MSTVLYLAEPDAEREEWQVHRVEFSSGYTDEVPDSRVIMGTCATEDEAVTAAFQMQRHGVTPRGVPDLTLASGRKHVEFMCTEGHPTMRHTICTRRVTHTGRHAAGNGDYLVAVWHGPKPAPKIDWLDLLDNDGADLD